MVTLQNLFKTSGYFIFHSAGHKQTFLVSPMSAGELND